MKKLDSTINIRQKLDLIHEHWSPRIIAQLNDYHVKLAKIEGEFIWHSHPETDEAFWVIAGQMRILFRDGAVTLNEGELFVVPRGVEHKPVAEQECAILLLEPAGTVNTGDAGGELTVSETPWI
jgi:mannose-6-phosphate isomerase-like protein (cupin superfamily)